jgi:hypothetical protein
VTGWLSSSWWVGIAAIAGIVVAVATCAAVVVAVWIARRQQGLAERLARIEEERHMLATRPVFSARLGHWSADVGSWIQPVIYVQNDGERAANDVHVLVTIGSYSSSFSRDRLARSDEPWEIRPQVAWAYVEEVPDPAAEANPSRPRAFLPATRPMFRWPLHVQIKHDREPGAFTLDLGYDPSPPIVFQAAPG